MGTGAFLLQSMGSPVISVSASENICSHCEQELGKIVVSTLKALESCCPLPLGLSPPPPKGKQDDGIEAVYHQAFPGVQGARRKKGLLPHILLVT